MSSAPQIATTTAVGGRGGEREEDGDKRKSDAMGSSS
jgi:hypothetical protein